MDGARSCKAARMGDPFTGPPDQLGCVVTDLDAAIADWAARGVGPFLVMRNVALAAFTYQGRPSKAKADIAFSQQGETQIELIRPRGDAATHYRDFLAAGHSGEHHQGWFCEDYEAEVAAAERAGRTVVQQGRWGAVRFAYYEPLPGEQRLGELIEMSPLSEEVFALIRREAERWDGTRPSRSLIAAAGWGLRWTALKVEVATRLGRG
jgi:hypothetical protein